MLYKKKEYLKLILASLELVINISVISAISFYYNIKQKDNKVFITSLYKINHILDN